jgi:hypothetical protein
VPDSARLDTPVLVGTTAQRPIEASVNIATYKLTEGINNVLKITWYSANAFHQ